VNIVKQISSLMMLIKKQNFHLIYMSEYLQQFNLNVQHKFEKQHIVLNVLSRLVSIMFSDIDMKKDKLNTLFMKIYAEMSDEF